MAITWQGLILIRTFPKKAKAIKQFFTTLIFSFAVDGIMSEPIVKRAMAEKPSSRRSAKFNYEVGFEMIQIDFNLTTMIRQVAKIRTHLTQIRGSKPLLSSDAENHAVDSLLLDCEIKTNATSTELTQIGNFFYEGTARDPRSAEFLGELWHEVSGSPGPLEYHKEVEALHRIEITFGHTRNALEDQQNEIKLLSSTSEKEQNEIVKSGKAIESVTNRFMKFSSSENSVDSVVDFHAKCDVLNFQMRNKAKDIKHAIEMGTEGRPSVDLIHMDEFRAHIKTIKHDQKILSPIFAPDEAQLYFTLPLVRMRWENNVVRFFVRIPLVDFSKRYEISPINKATSNKLSNYDYILTSTDGKYFRFLSDAELKSCIKTKGQFISDLRVVQSSLRMLNCNLLGCTGKNDNGPFEITQLTATSFAYSSNIDQNATLLCNKRRERVFLPKEGFITIPHDCSLMSNLFDIDFFPTDASFAKLTNKMKFAVSKLDIDESTKEGQWHLGLDKLSADVNSNMLKLDDAKNEWRRNMGEISQDLTALNADTKFLQNQVYGGIGVAGFFMICLIVAGISLCCFLKRRFATFVRV